MEFFILASEAWFLCSGLDLFYTVTNPFSRFEPRYEAIGLLYTNNMLQIFLLV